MVATQGILNINQKVLDLPDLIDNTYPVQTEIGMKYFELSNHLGNVLTTISDRKIEHGSGTTVDYYTADIISATDYYPFGFAMDERNFSSGEYRFGFNGQEKDDEFTNSTSLYDFGARIYDSRIGRWLALDFYFRDYPNISNYSSYLNNPIEFIDKNGNYIVNSDGTVVKFRIKRDGTVKFKSTVDPFNKKVIETMASNSKSKEILLQISNNKEINVQYKKMSEKMDNYIKESYNFDAWGALFSKDEESLINSYLDGDISKEEFDKHLGELNQKQFIPFAYSPEGVKIFSKDKTIFKNQVILIDDNQIENDFEDKVKEFLLTATEESIHALQDYVAKPTGELTQEEYENLPHEKQAKNYLKEVENEYNNNVKNKN